MRKTNKQEAKMKTVTLKLTESEFKTLSGNNLSHLGIGLLFTYTENRNKGIEIQNMDKFREFLNDEMLHHFTMADDDIVIHKNLKSILSKLDS